MKSYTDLPQSKMLAEILPIESADMYYYCGDEYDLRIGGYKAMDLDLDIPAWSLSALMNAIPNRVEYEFKTYFFKLETDVYSSGEKYYDLGYQGAYGWLEYEDSTELVDACVNLIIKLHERELL